MTTFQTDQAKRLNISHRTDDAVNLSIDVTDSSGVDYDFTGYTATFTIYDSLKEHYQFTTSSEITLTAGNISILIPTGSILLGVGNYQYSLRLILGGNKYTWLYGDFSISKVL